MSRCLNFLFFHCSIFFCLNHVGLTVEYSELKSVKDTSFYPTQAIQLLSKFLLSKHMGANSTDLFQDSAAHKRNRTVSSRCTLGIFAQALRLSLSSVAENPEGVGTIKYFLRNLPVDQQKLAEEIYKSQLSSVDNRLAITLSDCGWSDFSMTHVSNGTVVEYAQALTREDYDNVYFTQNKLGNLHVNPKTCAIAFHGTPTVYERLHGNVLWNNPKKKSESELDVDTILLMKGSVKTSVSFETYDLYKPFIDEYIIRTNNSAFLSWLALAASQTCKHLLIVGWSSGGPQSTIHRIDIGNTVSGKYTETCLAGKPCTLVAVTPAAGFWFGRVPEFRTMSNRSVYAWYESDHVQTSFSMSLIFHSTQSRKLLKENGIDDYRDPKNILIVWRTHDFCVSGSESAHVATEVEVPSSMSAIQFRQGTAFQNRQHRINQFGPLVSFRFCPMFLSGKMHIYTQEWCDHLVPGDVFFTPIKFDDIPINKNQFTENACIPDLPGSIFHTWVTKR